MQRKERQQLRVGNSALPIKKLEKREEGSKRGTGRERER
jgi:hypothetical protein